ncbi:hypothetical protein BKA63DRAFT_500732 [Paraphoma chrysanthemicola]|nr:hypothetical protein BKA63DRAFT_500732 [Paraphoma chrysanthemicola]
MFQLRHLIRHQVPRSYILTQPWGQVRYARAKGWKPHWSPEKVATSDEYPLSVALWNKVRPILSEAPRSKKLSGTHVRPQIVSPGLCDDVLQYIAPSLEKYKGCTILDINPGVGLWSQKLHQFLQPRNHVLLEPDLDLYKDFLDPLLEAPGSTYKLVSKDTMKLESYNEIIDEGVCAGRERFDPADPKAQELNPELLVTGSLAWDPRLPGHGFDSMAKQLYFHFASAAWSNDLFHAMGPVRTLFWVESEDFSHMISQASTGMKKGNRLLEMMQQLEWVAIAERRHRQVGRGSLGREPQYEMESLVRALRNGHKNSMKVPPHRQDYSHSFAAQIEKASGGTGISRVDYMQGLLYDRQLQGTTPIGLATQGNIEAVETECQLRKDSPDIVLSPLLPMKQERRKDVPTSFARKRNLLQHSIRSKLAIEAIVDIGEELYNLERKVLKTGVGPERDALIKQVEQLDQAWDQAVGNIDDNAQSLPPAELDDRISLRYPPHPRNQWDGRAFEPLISYQDEAWPHNRMSLISAIPIPKPVDDTSDLHEWMQDFVSALYVEPAKPVPSALDTMQHGLSDIIRECPSLHDPDKGGRFLLKHLRVRVLTVEMIVELVKAYRDWPFKGPGTDHNRYFRNRNSKR